MEEAPPLHTGAGLIYQPSMAPASHIDYNVQLWAMFINASPLCCGAAPLQKLLTISMAAQTRSHYPPSPPQQPVHFSLYRLLFSLSFSFPPSSNMVIFNHLISWHTEQIAMSRELRPLETKQRVKGGGGREAALPLIKISKSDQYGRVCVRVWCVNVCPCFSAQGVHVCSWLFHIHLNLPDWLEKKPNVSVLFFFQLSKSTVGNPPMPKCASMRRHRAGDIATADLSCRVHNADEFASAKLVATEKATALPARP